MADTTMRHDVERARTLAEDGDEGLALALLTRRLAHVERVIDVAEACAVADATALVVRLSGPVAPARELDAHLERLDRVVAGWDGEALHEAVATAHLQRIEWIHDVDLDDAVVLVDLLRAAEGLVARFAAPGQAIGVRTAWAEAKLTDVILRTRLGRPAQERAIGFETLALALDGEDAPRLREIRTDALARAAAIRRDLDDVESSTALWELAARAAIASGAPEVRHRAALALFDAGRDEEEAAWRRAAAVLTETRWDDARGVEARCVYAAGLLGRLDPADGRGRAPAVWRDLIDRHAEGDAETRAVLWSWIAGAATDVDESPYVGLDVIAIADDAALHDEADATAPERLRLALRRAELTAHTGDPVTAVDLWARVESRFPHALDDPRIAAPAARGMLDRALRLTEIGRTPEALATIDRVLRRLRPDARTDHLAAQALYWRGRLTREAGDPAAAAALVDQAVARFAAHVDADVRVWAANALFSQWQSRAASPDGAPDPIARFLSLFADDADPRIARLDARARLRQAVEAHERGDTESAIRLLAALIDRHGDADDGEIADTVRVAADDLRILRIAAAGEGAESAVVELRAAIAEADGMIAAGQEEAALPLLEDIADRARRSDAPDAALLALVASDLIASVHADAGRWVQLADAARRGLLIPEDGDHRAQRIRARSHLRLAIAQTRLGDRATAIAVYDALDRLTDGSQDDEVLSARQLAAYNRAVLLDDDGHPAAADAYRHAVRVHDGSPATPVRRLRQVKALRNLALLTAAAGRIADAAAAYHHVIELALQAPDSETAARARSSASDLAALYERTGQLGAAADLHAWIATAPPIGFDAEALRDARRSAKRLSKAARRMR